MSRLISFCLFLIVQFHLYSCHITHDQETICSDNFKKARDLAYKNPNDIPSLDSALILVDRSMKCDSIKKAVVELKVRLLITLEKYKEGADFIDSLSVTDFKYPYKKKLTQDNFIALQSQSHNDPNNRNLALHQMAFELEKYINGRNLNAKEFEEAFLDLYAIKENFQDSLETNREVDSLKTKYPDKARFFEFLRQ